MDAGYCGGCSGHWTGGHFHYHLWLWSLTSKEEEVKSKKDYYNLGIVSTIEDDLSAAARVAYIKRVSLFPPSFLLLFSSLLLPASHPTGQEFTTFFHFSTHLIPLTPNIRLARRTVPFHNTLTRATHCIDNHPRLFLPTCVFLQDTYGTKTTQVIHSGIQAACGTSGPGHLYQSRRRNLSRLSFHGVSLG